MFAGIQHKIGAGIEARYKKELWQAVAVLTPFRNQAKLLKSRRSSLRHHGLRNPHKITMGTVHALQGAEREIVLFSTVYDKWQSLFFFDREHTLLNVAVSRAKDSFIVFGRRELFPQSGGPDHEKPSTVLQQYLFKMYGPAKPQAAPQEQRTT